MAKEIPVYLFVGFLESGKTKFIQETFEDPNFDSGDKTLLRDGRVRLKDCKSAKGKTYNATVLLGTEPDGRSKFSLEFEGGC